MSTETTQPNDLDACRRQLIALMEAWSQDRWSAGWLHALDERLHATGGVWETLGRAHGWPVGEYREWQWLSWDEAAEHYRRAEAAADGAR